MSKKLILGKRKKEKGIFYTALIRELCIFVKKCFNVLFLSN